MNVAPLLSLENVQTKYGNSQILHGISFEIQTGQVLGLFGRNGVGKTTTIQTILGLPSPSSGKIYLEGQCISGLPTHEIAGRGVSWVPQGHRVFRAVTVEQNLALAAAKSQPGPWTVERIYEHFPQLANRRKSFADRLSGGEQQMLAIARALIQNPRLFLMDEPSEGLAPAIVEEIAEIVKWLKDEGCSILLVEQNLSFGLHLAQQVVVMNKGQIVFNGTSEMFSNNFGALREFLGVSAQDVYKTRFGKEKGKI